MSDLLAQARPDDILLDWLRRHWWLDIPTIRDLLGCSRNAATKREIRLVEQKQATRHRLDERRIYLTRFGDSLGVQAFKQRRMVGLYCLKSGALRLLPAELADRFPDINYAHLVTYCALDDELQAVLVDRGIAEPSAIARKLHNYADEMEQVEAWRALVKADRFTFVILLPTQGRLEAVKHHVELHERRFVFFVEYEVIHA